MVGATATPLNRNTRRTCSRDPADPRRRSTQTRVSRPAATAPSISSTERLASTSPTPTPGFQPSGEPRARMMNVASPTSSASVVSARVTPLPSRISPSCPMRESFGSEMILRAATGRISFRPVETFISSAIGQILASRWLGVLALRASGKPVSPCPRHDRERIWNHRSTPMNTDNKTRRASHVRTSCLRPANLSPSIRVHLCASVVQEKHFVLSGIRRIRMPPSSRRRTPQQRHGA